MTSNIKVCVFVLRSTSKSLDLFKRECKNRVCFSPWSRVWVWGVLAIPKQIRKLIVQKIRALLQYLEITGDEHYCIHCAFFFTLHFLTRQLEWVFHLDKNGVISDVQSSLSISVHKKFLLLVGRIETAHRIQISMSAR